MNVPVTRTLAYVLRQQLARTALKLEIAEVAAVPDGLSVTITQQGVETTIPRLSTYTPTVGEPAYIIVADTVAFAVGAVGGVAGGGTAAPPTFLSGSGPPTAAVGTDGAVYLDTASMRMWGPKAAGAWPATAMGRLLPLTPTYAQLKAG